MSDSPAASDGAVRRRPTKNLPDQLSPKLLQGIKLVAGGMTRVAAARQLSLNPDYLTRVLATPMGRAELARVSGLLEADTIDKLSAAQTGLPATVNTMNADVDLAVLESVAKLRQIMQNDRSGPMAQATAAKEILKLGNAEARYARQAEPEDEIDVNEEDAALFRAAVSDLRELAALRSHDQDIVAAGHRPTAAGTVEPPAPKAVADATSPSVDGGPTAPSNGLDGLAVEGPVE